MSEKVHKGIGPLCAAEFFGYRNFVVGEIQEMQNVALCRWGSGIRGEAFKYSGTDLLEERDGRMTIFYTFIDGHSPMSFSTESELTASATATSDCVFPLLIPLNAKQSELYLYEERCNAELTS